MPIPVSMVDKGGIAVTAVPKGGIAVVVMNPSSEGSASTFIPVFKWIYLTVEDMTRGNFKCTAPEGSEEDVARAVKMEVSTPTGTYIYDISNGNVAKFAVNSSGELLLQGSTTFSSPLVFNTKPLVKPTNDASEPVADVIGQIRVGYPAVEEL